MDPILLPFAESDNLDYFALYASLKAYSGSLTEQIILSYLVSRHKCRMEAVGLYSIPHEHQDGLCDTLGCNRRALNRAFRKLEKEGKILLILHAHGTYARLTDAVTMPDASEKFVKIPVCRSIPVRPCKPRCPEFDIEHEGDFITEAEEKAAQRKYDREMKLYEKAREEYHEKLASYRRRCLEYSLTGRPYIMYRIVRAMYSEIPAAGAIKRAHQTHKKMKSLHTGAVYGIQGFQQWIVGDAKTLRKDVESILSVGNEYPLVWVNKQMALSNHLQQIFTPVPPSEYMDEKWSGKAGELAALDTWCEAVAEESREMQLRNRSLSKMNHYMAYLSLALRQWSVVHARYDWDSIIADVFDTPSQYGIPELGMIFCLTPMCGAVPILKAFGGDTFTLKKQRELTSRLAHGLAGKQREIWERPETQEAYRSGWDSWQRSACEWVECASPEAPTTPQSA